MLWGPAGIGKSEGIEEYCKRYAMAKGLKYSENIDDQGEDTFVCQVVNLHQFDAAELKGLPIPIYEEKVTRFFQTNCMPQKGHGIIVFDEINLATNLVMASGYSLINKRRLGDYELPTDWTTLCAGNTLSDRAFVQEMPFPLKNRMAHYFLAIPSVKEWCKNFAYTHNVPAIITNFLLFREDCLYMYKEDSPNEQTAVGTPRSWFKAGNVLNRLGDMTDFRKVQTILAGYVGDGVADEVVSWWKLSQAVDIDKAFKTKELPYKKGEGADMTYAYISAIVGYYKKYPTEDNAVTLIEWMKLFKKEDASVLIYQVIATVNKDFVKAYAKVKGMKEVDKLINEYMEMFK
jgi:hypothetical protein